MFPGGELHPLLQNQSLSNIFRVLSTITIINMWDAYLKNRQGGFMIKRNANKYYTLHQNDVRRMQDLVSKILIYLEMMLSWKWNLSTFVLSPNKYILKPQAFGFCASHCDCSLQAVSREADRGEGSRGSPGSSPGPYFRCHVSQSALLDQLRCGKGPCQIPDTSQFRVWAGFKSVPLKLPVVLTFSWRLRYICKNTNL